MPEGGEVLKQPSLTSVRVQFVAWFASVILFGGIGFGLLDLVYQEHMDCSNPETHESANTLLGWMVAIVSSVLPVVAAVWLARGVRRPLPVAALLLAVASMGVWKWILDVDCEWYALPL